jgi:predicted nucleotidyltransferase
MNPEMLQIPPELIESFCQKHHIRNLAKFGSFARNDIMPDSDIDILVDFEPGRIPGFDFFLLEVELSKILRRKVDLQTVNFLSPAKRILLPHVNPPDHIPKPLDLLHRVVIRRTHTHHTPGFHLTQLHGH